MISPKRASTGPWSPMTSMRSPTPSSASPRWRCVVVPWPWIKGSGCWAFLMHGVICGSPRSVFHRHAVLTLWRCVASSVQKMGVLQIWSPQWGVSEPGDWVVKNSRWVLVSFLLCISILVDILFYGCLFLDLILMGDRLTVIPHPISSFLFYFDLYRLTNYFLHSHRTSVKWIISPTIMGISKEPYECSKYNVLYDIPFVGSMHNMSNYPHLVFDSLRLRFMMCLVKCYSLLIGYFALLVMKSQCIFLTNMGFFKRNLIF